jgi:glycosyltransferase involved in cell wall biosynthesis
VGLRGSCGSAAAECLAERRTLAHKADLLLVPSHYLMARLTDWGCNGKARLTPYAYDRIRAQQIALVTLRASRHTGFSVVASSHLDESTRLGIESLLVAVSRLRLDCHVTIAGEGPALPALKARTAQLMVTDRVVFHESMSQPKLMEFFRGAKAYVDPIGLDGFPASALYALSEGCPVIAARAGAVPEVIRHHENGLLYTPGDPMALSEAIVTLASEPGLSLRLIRAGIETVEKHTWDATVEKVFEAIEALK